MFLEKEFMSKELIVNHCFFEYGCVRGGRVQIKSRMKEAEEKMGREVDVICFKQKIKRTERQNGRYKYAFTARPPCLVGRPLVYELFFCGFPNTFI